MSVEIIHLNNGKWGAREVKLGNTHIEDAAKTLLKFADKVDTREKPSFLAIITATQYVFRKTDGIYIIPLV
jgi:hypothetical protein